MNPTKLLKHALLRFHSIFPSVSHALHHILFVIGNGYEWHNGELVYWRPKGEKMGFKQIVKEEIAEMKCLIKVMRKMSPIALIRHERELHNYLFTVKNINRIVSMKAMDFSGERSLYPWSESALIFEIPDNATDEWLVVINRYIGNLLITLNMKQEAVTKIDKEYIEKLPALIQKVDDMMVERKLLIPMNERHELAMRLIAEIDMEDRNEQSARN